MISVVAFVTLVAIGAVLAVWKWRTRRESTRDASHRARRDGSVHECARPWLAVVVEGVGPAGVISVSTALTDDEVRAYAQQWKVDRNTSAMHLPAVGATFTARTVLAISAPDPYLCRMDLVVDEIDSMGEVVAVSIVVGTPAISPTLPVWPSGLRPRAVVHVRASATVITNADITPLVKETT